LLGEELVQLGDLDHPLSARQPGAGEQAGIKPALDRERRDPHHVRHLQRRHIALGAQIRHGLFPAPNGRDHHVALHLLTAFHEPALLVTLAGAVAFPTPRTSRISFNIPLLPPAIIHAVRMTPKRPGGRVNMMPNASNPALWLMIQHRAKATTSLKPLVSKVFSILVQIGCSNTSDSARSTSRARTVMNQRIFMRVAESARVAICRSGMVPSPSKRGCYMPSISHFNRPKIHSMLLNTIAK